MMLEEVRVLGKLEARDRESFEERSHFFNKAVVVEVMKDYMEKLETYIDKLPNRNCKGVPYKRIKGKNIFEADLDKKIYAPLMRDISRMKAAKNYKVMHSVLRSFMQNMIRLPYGTPKSKAWFDAYKGEGAFYTLKNLVMFHDCYVPVYGLSNGVLNKDGAMDYLNELLDAYQGQGWRMFALMNSVIEFNRFDFNKRMVEIYNK
jgi:hypothetical protein